MQLELKKSMWRLPSQTGATVWVRGKQETGLDVAAALADP